MLVVRNMQGAIDFYTKGFGFQLRSTFPMPDGTLGHAELTHKDSLIMLGPESQERGSLAPTGPSPVTLYVYVENVDETTARAAGMGGNVAMPAADMFWGDRCSLVIDPEGHSWMLATHYKTMTPEEMVQAMQALPPM
jgi:PhnB protein